MNYKIYFLSKLEYYDILYIKQSGFEAFAAQNVRQGAGLKLSSVIKIFLFPMWPASNKEFPTVVLKSVWLFHLQGIRSSCSVSIQRWKTTGNKLCGFTYNLFKPIFNPNCLFLIFYSLKKKITIKTGASNEGIALLLKLSFTLF